MAKPNLLKRDLPYGTGRAYFQTWDAAHRVFTALGKNMNIAHVTFVGEVGHYAVIWWRL